MLTLVYIVKESESVATEETPTIHKAQDKDYSMEWGMFPVLGRHRWARPTTLTIPRPWLVGSLGNGNGFLVMDFLVRVAGEPEAKTPSDLLDLD